MKTHFSLIMAVVAIAAFMVPALASAAALTEGGKSIPVGVTALWTSTNWTIKGSLGTLSCEKVTITGEVTHNSGGVVEAVGVGAGGGTGCTVAGKTFLVSDITLKSFEASGSGNVLNWTFKTVMSGTECHYEASSMNFTYTSGTDSFKITNGDMIGKPASVCEPGTINGDFTLETDASPFTAIILD